MNLKELLTSTPFSAFLVDVAGVLFSKTGYCKTSSTAFNTLQSIAPTLLATNNSYAYTSTIVETLLKNGNISISEDAIISSGHGLAHDPDIQSLLEGKCVYFLGNSSSLHYLLDAPIKGHTQNLDNADAIVLANYTDLNSEAELNAIIDRATQDPSCPVICCNPDQYILVESGLIPVMGYYATHIEKRLSRPMTWFGKPYQNFSNLVATRLAVQGIKSDRSVLFFDDNLENVIAMQNHLDVSGCWVHETGIMHHMSPSTAIDQYGTPTYIIPSFDLNCSVNV